MNEMEGGGILQKPYAPNQTNKGGKIKIKDKNKSEKKEKKSKVLRILI